MMCTDVIQSLGPYLDAQLDGATAVRIQAHLSHCQSCRLRFDQGQELGERIARSLKGCAAADDGRRWERILQRALPRSQAPRRPGGAFRIRAGSVAANWISLVASLVFLAALASAGLGLRHSGQLVLPGSSWMMQRYAQLPHRPPGDVAEPAGERPSQGAWDAPRRQPDA